MQRICTAVALLCTLLVGTGCTMLDQKNRILLNKLDDAAATSFLADSKGARIAVAPVALPVAVTAAAVDLAVITPARAVLPAYRDTRKMVWENPEGSDFRQAILFLPKVAATPVVYAGFWTVRSFLFSD